MHQTIEAHLETDFGMLRVCLAWQDSVERRPKHACVHCDGAC